MAVILDFPIKDRNALSLALESAQALYIKAGLSPNQAVAARGELELLLAPLAKEYESLMELPGDLGLSESQIATITSAHNQCIQALVAHFTQQLGYAVSTIAGLVGRNHTE